jgi:8-oxo-dGTP pyrophosphatase MutT (NUDIX family)
MSDPLRWPALAAAWAREPKARVPFFIEGCTVGSVARAHLSALRAWPRWLWVQDEAVTLRIGPATAARAADQPDTITARSDALATLNAALHRQGLVRGWRDEPFAVTDLASGRLLASTERAAARFWGTLTLGAHCNGYVADAHGRPTHLWIARRSATKATDPDLLDNLVGGGVPQGQTPHQTLLRESWEEAGLQPEQLCAAQAGPVLRLHRDIPEGLQLEDLHTFDLCLPTGLVPANQDGEVAGFECMPVAQALGHACNGAMTVDAALVTLDFGCRHGLFDTPTTQALEQAFAQGHRRDQKA